MSTEETIRSFCNQFQAGQIVEEAAWFWDAAKTIDPKIVVEIGIYGGGNLRILSSLVDDPNGVTVGIDYDDSHWKETRGWDFRESKCPVHIIWGDSHSEDTLNKLKTILNGRSIDVLFIDGDHGFDGCKKDFDMYGQLVRPGGIIAIHDTQMHRRPDEHPDVKKCGEFFDSLPEPKFEKHMAKRNYDGYGIGYIIK